MGNIYFEVKKTSKLYEDYFSYIKNVLVISDCFKSLCEEFGIETTEFYMTNTELKIVPTQNDFEKFKSQMKKTSYGTFKKSSLMSKKWLEITKDIKPFKKPQMFYYLNIYGSWKERLFHIGEKLYCSIETNHLVEVPEWGIEMKASELYRVIEESEDKA